MTSSNSNSYDNQGDLNSQLPSNEYEINSTRDLLQEQSNSLEAHHISLLEEKLQVARRKVKVGEVIVRKQVETRIIKIPIRREKLVIERIGENPELISEVVIGEEKVNGFKYEELNQTNSLHITKSQFLKLQTAQDLLAAISQLSSATNAKIRLEIVTNDSDHQIEHQQVCDRYH